MLFILSIKRQVDDNMKTGVEQHNEWTKCSQEQNVYLSHLENEALDFDVKQTEMGGGVISSFTDTPPTLSLCSS